MTRRPLALAALVCSALCLVAAPALAVSDPGYDPARQGCTGAADSAGHPDRVEDGCHNSQLTLEDGTGHRLLEASTDQTPDGTSVGPPTAGAHPEGFDPAGGLHAYFGADDNLDDGEHDSSDFSQNGPSDGGGVHADLSPDAVAEWQAAVQAGDTEYLRTHPLPVPAGAGGCADGACVDAQTQRGRMFQGPGSGERDAYDYSGKQWDPYTCGGPTDDAAHCGGQDLGAWNGTDGTVWAEPGVQVYEDPDPQGSPIDPLYDAGATPQPMLYPLPSAYVGTCGVAAAGRVAAGTGC